MAAIIEALFFALRALIRPVILLLTKYLWPQVLAFIGWLGLKKLFVSIWQYIQFQLAAGIFDRLVKAALVYGLLAAWNIILFVFWNWGSLGFIRDLFKANPFASISILAGSMYLASHAFPFHMLFGTMVAYISWRFTLIHAAIFFNRLVVYLRAGINK